MSAEADTVSPIEAADLFLNSLRKPARILVAISGGSDSTGLLIALSDWLKANPLSEISLVAATVDHGLRAESAAEALQVAALCGSLGIPHVTRLWRGPRPAAGVMAAAREARYDLLADATAELHANVIVTAHTLDDQHETLAMRNSRGGQADAAGLSGIADAVLFDHRLWVVRPILACRRADIRSFLTARGLSWIDDPSNEDEHYERVRTRKRLGGAGDQAGSPAKEAAARRLGLSAAAADWLTTHFSLEGGVLGRLDRAALAADPAVLSYGLGYLAATLGGQAFPPGREALQRVIDFLASGEPGRRTVGRVVFDLRRDGLYLVREGRGILPLSLGPGERGIWDGRFEIANAGSGAIRVEGGGDIGAWPPFLPKAAVRRAAAVRPRIMDESGELLAGEQARLVAIAAVLAPFDRFLTRFDLTFADSLAAAFGRKTYPGLPF
ncbi:tRNA lysidine(34) synthetase TilS [Rhizobium sp. BK251]|uniref:tRNA lysidine(34) synthetase TilS n=1 Tax=Rhizobium sp. BK251 TaxID=2512125 RepID=UPI00104BE33A|nr:tRNA lysidine(34) synthetase TilS [Rhizobium sp. BK251]TCL69819.1 tRNA(Ile)-lysidine synthase [Rhizobium sp. BK251]